jgi:hypothetical protein
MPKPLVIELSFVACLVDINSDGLIDILEGIHTTKKVYLNTGSSWVRSYKHQTSAATIVRYFPTVALVNISCCNVT